MFFNYMLSNKLAWNIMDKILRKKKNQINYFSFPPTLIHNLHLFYFNFPDYNLHLKEATIFSTTICVQQ